MIERIIFAVLCLSVALVALFTYGLWTGNDIAVEIACRIMALMEGES